MPAYLSNTQLTVLKYHTIAENDTKNDSINYLIKKKKNIIIT